MAMPKPRLIINAGGSSRRMGQTKALLPVPPTGQPLILSIANRLRSLVEPPIVVVTNDSAVGELLANEIVIDCLTDVYPGEGPLGGLITALPLCDDWAMVAACDMPLINPAVFALLWQIADANASELDVVIPQIDGYAQPLHALYHRRIVPTLQEAFDNGERSIQRILPELRARTVDAEEIRPIDPQLQSFINVNTPEEWAAVQQQLLAQSS